MNNNMSLAKILPIGLMLFSFFFGAGNLIFPPALGQMAGENLPAAKLGDGHLGILHQRRRPAPFGYSGHGYFKWR